MIWVREANHEETSDSALQLLSSFLPRETRKGNPSHWIDEHPPSQTALGGNDDEIGGRRVAIGSAQWRPSLAHLHLISMHERESDIKHAW